MQAVIAAGISRPFAYALTLLAVSMAVMANGCGGREAAAPRRGADLDLLAAFPDAQVRQETAAFDLGTEAGRFVLREGWSTDEGTPGERTFVWAVGRESTLSFFALGSHDLRLELRGWSLAYPNSGGQTIGVEVNGVVLDEAPLAEGGGTLRFHLPARALRRGSNELLLRSAFAVAPSEVLGTEDKRELAAAWDSVSLQGPAPSEKSQVQVRSNELILPYGTQVDYYLRLPAGAVLAIDDLSGDDKGVLEIDVARDQLPPISAELGNADGGQRLGLGDQAGVVRLSFAAISRSAGGAGASSSPLRLELPRIEFPEMPERLTHAEGAGRRANVVIYMVDTLRADRLGCYGAKRPLTPRIDQFAEDAALFEQAIAQSSWTRPSVASIFTGLGPDTHGVQDRRHRLAEDNVTLAEVLRDEGYETMGWVNNPNVAGRFGLGQGFDNYRLTGRGPARDLNKTFERWLSEREDQSRPFLVYLHTVEPHAPYSPSPGFQRRFAPNVDDSELTSLRILRQLAHDEVQASPGLTADLFALYDAEVAGADANFGDFLDILERSPVAADTIVVFVSDHGEEFREHGRWQHGHSLYTEVLDVPLIVRFPDLARGARIEQPVQHVDLLPTLLAYLGVEAPKMVEGRDLMAILRGSAASDGGDGWILSTIDVDGFTGRSVTTPTHRFILPQSENMGSDVQLYDRVSDPGERTNVAAEWPILSEYLRILLTSVEASTEAVPTVDEEDLEPEVLEQMRALGYVD